MARRPLSDLSPAYRRRVERALAKGLTLQQARGHRQAEHRERAERERRREGLSSYEREAVRRWYEQRFNPQGYKGKPSLDEVLGQVRREGYGWFQQYREVWGEVRRDYLRRKAQGRHISRPGLLQMMGAPPSEAEGGGGRGAEGGRREGEGGTAPRYVPGGMIGGGPEGSDFSQQDYDDLEDGWDGEEFEVPDDNWLYYH